MSQYPFSVLVAQLEEKTGEKSSLQRQRCIVPATRFKHSLKKWIHVVKKSPEEMEAVSNEKEVMTFVHDLARIG